MVYTGSMASVLVQIIVLFFDLIAFGLAIGAEQRRSTGTVTTNLANTYTYCVYDSDVASNYGVGALVILLVSQIIIMAATKCLFCGRSARHGGSRACALFLFVICWLTFIIAEACLLAGSVRNAYHTQYRMLFVKNPPSCDTVRKGVFAAGTAFIFFTAVFSQCYYIAFWRANPPYPKEFFIGMIPY